MSEDQKPQSPETTPEAPASVPEGPPATSEDDSKARIRTQLAEYGSTIKEQAAKLAEFEAAEAKRLEAEALQRGEHEKLLAELKESTAAKESAWEAEKKAFNMKIVTAEARAKLTGLDELQMKGALASMPDDITVEGIDAWVAEFKESNASIFEQKPTGVSSGSSSAPHLGSSANDVKSILKDPKHPRYMWALNERMEQQAEGTWTE